MPKRNKKRFNRPRKAYDSVRIAEENILTKKYGLKNKREVWRSDFAVGEIRDSAKKLITAPENEQKKFVEKQRAKGFNVNSIADILSLNKEDYMKRRLQSVLVEKKIARTAKQARQFIAHKLITVKGGTINSPSHIVSVEEEKDIKLIAKIPIKKENKNDEENVEISEENEEVAE